MNTLATIQSPAHDVNVSVEEIVAWQWTCDRCKRKKILPGDDKQPPDHWISDGLFTFCSYAHHREFLKIIEDARDC